MPLPFIKDDYLVCPVTVNPALDRRFPMLNGGGRTPIGDYMGVTYRSPWCRHGWRAQQRTSTLGATNKAYFGCRGYVQYHEVADEFDCGYVEEGVVDLGVASIQVPNPAWSGVFIYPPDENAWIKRAHDLRKEPKTSFPDADEEIGQASPTRPGSPNKAYYAGRLGSQPSSSSRASPSTPPGASPPSPSKSKSSPLYRAAPSSPARPAPPATSNASTSRLRTTTDG